MAKRNKIERIANVRKQCALGLKELFGLRQAATYYEVERMTEKEFLSDAVAYRDALQSVVNSITRELERKQPESPEKT